MGFQRALAIFVFIGLLGPLAACSDATAPSEPADESSGDTDGSDDEAPATGDDDAPGDGGTVTYPACATQPMPVSCGLAATTQPAAGELGADGSAEVVVETFDNSNTKAPLPVSVYRPAGASQVPVLFFAHAYAATKVVSYDHLLRNLASNGIAVVFVPYASVGPGIDNAERYAQLWQGFMDASIAYADVFDLTRVGFAGHSFGGGATPEMARRGFVTEHWGANGRFMFIMAPWYSWGSDYDTLPLDTRTIVQVYADDASNDHQIAVHDIWNELPPGLDAGWLLIRSDVCDCGLNADHVLPMDAAQVPTDDLRLNGLDGWGVQRRLLALARYAFDHDLAARDIAYGVDSAMGHWIGCGGRAVRPLEASTSPLTTTCQTQLYPLSKRCENADADYPCE